MIETIIQSFSSNYNPDKADKHNGWIAMIGIISDIGAFPVAL